MKKISAITILVCASVLTIAAQGQQDNRRVIEVSGSAERMVIPDEFTFKITLIERIENKKKIAIEQQEADLRNELTKLGVDVNKDLSIYDISSMYFRQKKIKDVLGMKDYRLKIRDLNKIAQLQDLADRLNIARLDLIDTDNSEMTRHRREVKIEAIKAAKAKAEYLLAAVSERIGKAVYVKEEEEEKPSYQSNLSANSISPGLVMIDATSEVKDSLSFSATKLRFVIVAKFEIE